MPLLHECSFEVHFMLAQSLSQVNEQETSEKLLEFILGLSFFPTLLRLHLTLSNAHNYPLVVLYNHPHFKLFMYCFDILNPFYAGVRNLSIPSPYYEILVLGPNRQLQHDDGTSRRIISKAHFIFIILRSHNCAAQSFTQWMASGIDVRYICSQCSFSDKIRAAFVQSTMEIVCVEDLLHFYFPSLLCGPC